MGFFFSNLHIRKTKDISLKNVLSLVTELMEKRGFRAIASDEEADLTVSLLDNESDWISICSDGLDFYSDEDAREMKGSVSRQLSTDVMSISCFDSDCLLLNLINDVQGKSAWAKTGRFPGVKERSTPAKWQEFVSDVQRFESVLKKDFIFSEEALAELEPLLGLAPGQGEFSPELIAGKVFSNQIHQLSFALPETAERPDLPRLEITRYDLMPCEMGEDTIITAVNKGGKSIGLAVVFAGDYVENDEIRFRDVQLEYDFERQPRPTIGMQLEKQQTVDGKWIYYGEVPQFQFLPGVKAGLPRHKAMNEEFKREFGVRFTPEGNERKRLDIAVFLIPLKNYEEGQCGWCVWWPFKSKKAFIENHNRTWGTGLFSGPKLLDASALDLDD